MTGTRGGLEHRRREFRLREDSYVRQFHCIHPREGSLRLWCSCFLGICPAEKRVVPPSVVGTFVLLFAHPSFVTPPSSPFSTPKDVRNTSDDISRLFVGRNDCGRILRLRACEPCASRGNQCWGNQYESTPRSYLGSQASALFFFLRFSRGPETQDPPSLGV